MLKSHNHLDTIEPFQSPQKYIVPGLQRGMQILRMFNRERTQIGSPEISKELGIPRSTVFRLMLTLEYMGFLEKAINTGDYRLGVSVLSLGFEFIASLGVTELARPILEKLRDETGFSSHLVIRDGRDVVCIVKVASRSTFASSINIGARLPAHGTVLGRVLLADLSAAELALIYADDVLNQYSDQTPVTLSELNSLLNKDRKLGYAISNAYYENGIGAIAAQVKDGSQRVIAAINVSYQVANVELENIEKNILQCLLDAAAELSQLMDYHPRVLNTKQKVKL